MNGKALSQVGLGLLGVWVLVQALIASFRVLSNLQALASSPQPALAAATIIPVAMLFLVSYVLVVHNAAAAKRMFPNLPDGTDHARSGQAPILVGLLGVFLFCMAIPQLLQLLPSLRPSDPLAAGTIALQRRALAGYGIQVVLAMILTLRPAVILRLWERPDRERSA